MKRVYLVRHGEAYHNLGDPLDNADMHDPILTKTGIQQCEGLRKKLADAKLPFDIIVSSPFRRALQTVELALTEYLQGDNRLPHVVVSPLFEEFGDLPCDHGSLVYELERQFPAFNFEQCNDGIFPEKQDLYASTPDMLKRRCQIAKRFLDSLPYDRILVVTHATLLRFLLSDLNSSEAPVATPRNHFQNCELKAFDLKKLANGDCVFETVA
ncbi:phosphoglycerate mutase family protein [Schizosaccharomyces japonicus yFS275]|uniref:Phosphoglycerate mutase family protein n=1 Tax=Schizosaccharomyces japonicus (strain yFS275 / FY16936) TaxID=402676 RepID=B6K305_SCHJY|nr:phosphoglycerate mutase family protein [Schizosaccharomyces japonicus yFS275]EEB07862.1 phosphoglycerate mutase family protein [Schizosaccharomyces japonicus yFS275]